MIKKIEFENNAPYKIQIIELDGEETHFHDTAEIIFVLKGSIYAKIGDYYRKSNPGSGIFIAPGEKHYLNSNELCIIAKLYFNPQFFELYKVKSIIDSHIFLMETKEINYSYLLRNFIIRILMLLYKNTSESKKILDKHINKVYQISMYSISEYNCYKNSKIQITQSVLDRYNRILDFITSNCNRHFKISEIAEKEHISETRLSHFWKDVTGTSLQNAVISIKMLKARELIVSSDLSINKISELCGFYEKKYFYKYFREVFNITPKEYRDQYKVNVQHSQRPFNSRVLPEEEAEAYINQYLIQYYIVNCEFPPNIIPQQEVLKEKALSDLFKSIQKNQTKEIQKVPQIKSISYTLLLYENRVIYSDGDNYKINWEYVYIFIQYAIKYSFDIRIIIDFEIMEEVLWLNIFKQFQLEIYKIWGETLPISFECAILVKKFYSYKETEDLINRFREAVPIFEQIDLIYVL